MNLPDTEYTIYGVPCQTIIENGHVWLKVSLMELELAMGAYKLPSAADLDRVAQEEEIKERTSHAHS